MAISNIRIISSDKVMTYVKGVGAEDSYVKDCIRHGEIRFTVLSYLLVRRAIGFRFTELLMIAFTGLSFFLCIYIKDRLSKL